MARLGLGRSGRLPPLAVVAAANAALVAAVGSGSVLLLLLAALIVAPAAAAVLRRPQLGVLALVALIPYDGLLAVVPHPSYVPAWKEALLVLTLGATFVAPPAARAGPGRPWPPWALPLAGLLAVGVVSAGFVGGLTGLYGLKVYFFFALVFVVLRRCPFNPTELDRVVSILMVNAVITAAVGVAQQVAGPERLNELGYEYNSVIRFSGDFLRSFSTFDQPFPFGYFLMVALLVCLPVALADPRRPRNQLFLFALPLVGAGLISCLVRGAWLGFAAGLAYLGAHRYRLLLFAIPLGLVALLFLPPDASRSALSTESSRQRVAGWVEQVDVILAHPFGAGIGTAGSTAERVQQLRGESVDYVQPDNHYFLVAYELGLLGLWWHLLLVGSAFGAARAASRRLSAPENAFAAGVAAVVVAAVVASVMSTWFQITPNDLLWWLMLAAVAPASAAAPDGPRPVASTAVAGR